jgi:hypothetical protein
MRACSLVVDTERQLIKDIIINKNPDFANKTVNYIINNLKSGKLNKEVLIFTERLNKPLNDYDKITPHIAAAMRMIDLGYSVNVGDPISYFICAGLGSLSDRAEPFYVAERKEVDTDYYVDKLLLPMKKNLFKATGIIKSENWYSYYLKTYHWLLLRHKTLKNADFKCQVCSSILDLQVHHNTYDRIWNEKISDLVVLCSKHHELIHNAGGVQWHGEKSSPVSA